MLIGGVGKMLIQLGINCFLSLQIRLQPHSTLYYLSILFVLSTPSQLLGVMMLTLDSQNLSFHLFSHVLFHWYEALMKSCYGLGHV